MKTPREHFIMQRLKEHYSEVQELGFEVVALFLQGSQNYQLDIYTDFYKSDIDSKAIILPTLDDIIEGKESYSHTHVRQNDEHIDIKDIRVMFEMFKKQNNSYLEILFTPFVIINPKYKSLMQELYCIKDAIVRMNTNAALRALSGTSKEKLNALEHPYPSAMKKLNEFGYDPKQLHHILRINDLTRKYVNDVPYSDCLIPDNKQFLIDVKLGKIYSLEEARIVAKQVDTQTWEIKNQYLKEPEPVDNSTWVKLKELKKKFIKQFLIEEIKEK